MGQTADATLFLLVQDLVIPCGRVMKLIKKSRHRPFPERRISMASSPTRLVYGRIAQFAFISVLTCIIGFSSIALWGSFPYLHSRPRPIYGVQVLNEFPHDSAAFTQGLLYAGNDTLFESTGLYGRSSVRKVSLRNGKIHVLQRLGKKHFGEGLTLLGERLFQLTWLTNYGFTYDRRNLSKIEKFTHSMEDGWGLASDGKVLFGSDGTSSLYRIDPRTMRVMKKYVVRYLGREISRLNELEFVKGEVWANIWQSDCIARISVEDGAVHGWIILGDLRQRLLADGHDGIDVLNGIAWDSIEDRLFVTGKLWPKLFQIKLHRVDQAPHLPPIERQCLL